MLTNLSAHNLTKNKKMIDIRQKILMIAIEKSHWRFFMKAPEEIYGGVAERSIATDCKSVDLVYDGSNPSPSTTIITLDVGLTKRV